MEQIGTKEYSCNLPLHCVTFGSRYDAIFSGIEAYLTVVACVVWLLTIAITPLLHVLLDVIKETEVLVCRFPDSMLFGSIHIAPVPTLLTGCD